MVTGLVVNDGLKVPSYIKKEIRLHLYFANKWGVKEHLERQNRGLKTKIKSNFRDYLLGKIHFVNSVEPHTGQKMLELFNQISWEI
jgi:hypothetical protein